MKHPRHDLSPLEISQITSFFEDYISGEPSRCKLKKYVNDLANSISPEYALESLDLMRDLQRDEKGNSTERKVVEYISDFQNQFLGRCVHDEHNILRIQEK